MQAAVVDKATAKRCIMTVMPTLPGPVVDYALSNSPFFASIPPASEQPAADADAPPFACRKMNSGNWGELSIVSPKGGKHLKMAERFSDGSNFCFTLHTDRPSR